MEGVSTVLRRLLLALILAAACALSFYKLQSDWQFFGQCPNRDVLSWDANLRMTYTLDGRDDFQSGHAWRAVIASLRSPTWPPLHGWISSALYLFSEPSTITEAGIGFAFYALLCLSLIVLGPVCARLLSLPAWTGAAAALFTLVCIFHSKELTAYSLSAMLETQGMFFFLLFSAVLLRAASESRPTAAMLLATSLGLFMTKFPYGHILIMAIVPAALVQHRESVPRLLNYVWVTYRGRALILPALLAAIVAFLALARFLPGTPPNVKFFKYTFYAVVVALLVDFNVRLYWNRAHLMWVPPLWKNLYLWTALPILVLTLIEPDRFSSTVGTQLHQQDASRSFLWSIFADFLDHPLPVLALCAVLLTALAVRLRQRKPFPASMVILTVFFHLLILELLTSNKQLRHIYHIMPALLFLGTLAALPAFQAGLRSILLAAILSSGAYLLFAKGSLLKPEHYAVRYACWTGPSRDMFEPVRALVKQVPRSEKGAARTVIFNEFHSPAAPMPGRVWATDIDLMLRFQLNFAARNDSRHEWKSWEEFDRLLHVSPGCTDSPQLVERARSMQMQIVRVADYRAPGDLCITDYRLSRTAERQ